MSYVFGWINNRYVLMFLCVMVAVSAGCTSGGGGTVNNTYVTPEPSASPSPEPSPSPSPSPTPLVSAFALDPDFGTAGKVTTAVGAAHDEAKAVAFQSDGSLVVVGSSEMEDGTTDFAVVRFTSAGALDETFGEGGIVTTDFNTGNDVANSVAVLSDGKIVVAGTANSGVNLDFAIAVYDSVGVLVPDFDTDGKILTDFGTGDDGAQVLAVQEDGSWVLAGYAATVGTRDFAIARYTSLGVLDVTFDTDGLVTQDFTGTTDAVSALKIQPDLKLTVLGTANDGVDNDFAILRLDSVGALDAGFGTAGKTVTDFGTNTNDQALSLALGANGDFFAAGQSVNADGNSDFAVARYNSNGSLDTNFNLTGKVMSDISESEDNAKAMALDVNGALVVAGSSKLDLGYDFMLASYVGDGSLNSGFTSQGYLSTAVGSGHDFANAMAIHEDGTIVVVGRSFVSTDYDFSVVRYKNPALVIEEEEEVVEEVVE